jgi:signal transduction histidine kinase
MASDRTAAIDYVSDLQQGTDCCDVVRNQFAVGLPSETSESEQSRDVSALVLQRYDEDRRWIAGQLHEVTAQNVVAIRVYLESLRQRGTWPPEIKALLASCQSLCEQSLEQILTLSKLLHPPILDELGLAACLGQYIVDFRKKSGMHVAFEIRSEVGRLPQEMETHLFRVAQERLANISRHSGSLKAIVRLERRADQVILQIEDFGLGVPADAEAGLGILAMQERLKKIGGCLKIRSSNRGTMLAASVRV